MVMSIYTHTDFRMKETVHQNNLAQTVFVLFFSRIYLDLDYLYNFK